MTVKNRRKISGENGMKIGEWRKNVSQSWRENERKYGVGNVAKININL
jgi:hypothetical protein